MSEAAHKRLPLLRLALYLVILGGCGEVAGHELYYAVGGTTTVATVLTVSRAPVGGRTLRFRAEYEYFDDQQQRHVGRADGVPPVTNPGDVIDIQYLWHDPATSRLAPSPAQGLCFGMVAVLAGVVFVGELLVRRRRRRRRRGWTME